MAVILVVDDDDDVREAVADALRGMGHAVHCAADGRVALWQLNEIRPDLILLDVMMPVMGGLEFLRHLRAHAPLAAIPVVISSASIAEHVDGASGVLRKPFDVQELRNAVELVLREPGRALASPSA